jgi:putative Mn2+ efflux pump MntP
MGLTCGVFQFCMPVLGWTAGIYALDTISSFDHWVAFGLLAFVGGSMIKGSFETENKCEMYAAMGAASLLYLGLATSIDALAVGASFGIAGKPIMILAGSAGLITLVLCFFGVSFGRYAGIWLGKRSELAGGAVLICIGLNILREHLL